MRRIRVTYQCDCGKKYETHPELESHQTLRLMRQDIKKIIRKITAIIK